MILLAGRAAEKEIYNEVSAGASDDLRRATSIIHDMFLRFSMREDDDVSLVLTDDSELNGVITKDVYDNMTAFKKKCYSETKAILVAKKDKLMKLAERLMEKETLSKYDIERILDE